MPISGLLLVSICAFGSGFTLNELRHRVRLPIMKLTLAKSVALWAAILTALFGFTFGLQWLVQSGVV